MHNLTFVAFIIAVFLYCVFSDPIWSARTRRKKHTTPSHPQHVAHCDGSSDSGGAD